MTNRTVTVALGAGAVLATAGLVTAMPLAVYACSLAAFGLPHVLSEMRYVDARFHARLGRRVGWGLGLLLAALVAVRLLAMGGLVSADGSRLLQVAVLAGLVVLVGPRLWAKGMWATGVGAAGLVLLAWGVLTAPVATLVVLAVLHNVTPVGFLAERLQGRARRRAMLFCALGFGVVPLLLASGVPTALWDSLGWLDGERSVLSVGSLEDHLGVFVPPALRDDPRALHWFTAAVYLQCAHYAAVLHVLPRLLNEDEDGRVPAWFDWPARRAFRLAVAAAGALFFVGFALSFGDARSVYGVFAAVHAWVEVPLLLIALPGRSLS